MPDGKAYSTPSVRHAVCESSSRNGIGPSERQDCARPADNPKRRVDRASSDSRITPSATTSLNRRIRTGSSMVSRRWFAWRVRKRRRYPGPVEGRPGMRTQAMLGHRGATDQDQRHKTRACQRFTILKARISFAPWQSWMTLSHPIRFEISRIIAFGSPDLVRTVRHSMRDGRQAGDAGDGALKAAFERQGGHCFHCRPGIRRNHYRRNAAGITFGPKLTVAAIISTISSSRVGRATSIRVLATSCNSGSNAAPTT